MEMLSGEQITAAALTDWRKLGQGLHARFVIPDFGAGVRFLRHRRGRDSRRALSRGSDGHGSCRS